MEMWLIYFFNQLKPEVAELYVGYDHHRDIITYVLVVYSGGVQRHLVANYHVVSNV